ncbi:hypothetical protein K4K61_012123 [Colletotrichum sp. SAR11_59]|uniref:Peptidyl-tRNA hydrolase n=1 Tax=Colletotrichum asianum TaxID=702518 RepID=A0A8H3ZT10_9PEZI|nr:hypothetical protein GQ607_007523 [Colletotrichum asianum]KAI8277504.1 hypothetical protein K4K59_009475 [Colletotrichum sp. SAR11_240]KAI8311401.1 hypothetical protein K4K61_012123 [Colletotrichum sp. SAR11_59]
MRVSATTILALPLLAAAAESPFEQYKAQFQNFLSSFGASAPSATKQDTPEAAAPDAVAKSVSVLTVDNWKDVLYAPVKAEATTPEEWWVLITGRNKTCFGHCDKIETAFNESASKFAKLPESPHLGLLNCDDEPVLCNAFSASSASLWSIGMLPPGAQVDIWRKRLNVTTTTSDDIIDLWKKGNKEDWILTENIFHPFNSWVAQNNLSIPVGYFFWAFNLIPNWLFMLLVSFGSRTLMNRRMNNTLDGRQAAAGGAAPAAGAAR